MCFYKNRLNLPRSPLHADTGGIGLLVNSREYSSLTNIEIISPRIMMATFNRYPNTTPRKQE